MSKEKSKLQEDVESKKKENQKLKEENISEKKQIQSLTTQEKHDQEIIKQDQTNMAQEKATESKLNAEIEGLKKDLYNTKKERDEQKADSEKKSKQYS